MLGEKWVAQTPHPPGPSRSETERYRCRYPDQRCSGYLRGTCPLLKMGQAHIQRWLGDICRYWMKSIAQTKGIFESPAFRLCSWEKPIIPLKGATVTGPNAPSRSAPDSRFPVTWKELLLPVIYREMRPLIIGINFQFGKSK